MTSLGRLLGEEHEVFIESSVRGYHVYFVNASVAIGKVLTCERDHDNVHDKYAIAVKDEDQTWVGHVPIELSKIFSRFLQDYGEIEAECIGARYNKSKGKGLEIPVEYKLIGNYKYLEKLVSRIKGRESTSGLSISEVKS